MYSIEARGLVKTYPLPGKAPGNAPDKAPDKAKAPASEKAKNARLKALDGLDLSVPAGTIFALVGPNGAGKTTTVKILTSLATPDEGDAMIEGVDVLAAPAKARRLIGVAP